MESNTSSEASASSEVLDDESRTVGAEEILVAVNNVKLEFLTRLLRRQKKN